MTSIKKTANNSLVLNQAKCVLKSYIIMIKLMF